MSQIKRDNFEEVLSDTVSFIIFYAENHPWNASIIPYHLFLGDFDTQFQVCWHHMPQAAFFSNGSWIIIHHGMKHNYQAEKALKLFSVPEFSEWSNLDSNVSFKHIMIFRHFSINTQFFLWLHEKLWKLYAGITNHPQTPLGMMRFPSTLFCITGTQDQSYC